MSGENLKPTDVESLLVKTEAFINTMYYVHDDFTLIPKKDHIGTIINYSDLQQMRNDFVEEMIHTVVKYVYSEEEQNKIIGVFTNEGRDKSAAYSKLTRKATQKFRRDHIKGQFSELLLFNLLQYHFKAVPLLRKMPITTNPKLERNGADAFHISHQNGKYILYLGEAKTYNRETSSLRSALKDSISSILEHYNNHRNELNLYIYEDFIPNELEKIADNYINGKLKDIEIHLVCMITYDNKKDVNGNCREELINSEISSITEETKKIKKDVFREIPSILIPRINYIIFPIKNMNELIEVFEKNLGIPSYAGN
jgi:hypothetical protein